MANLYRNYLRLLEKWPLDPTKKSRDLGQFIREQVKVSFLSGEICNPQDINKCKKTYEILNRFADNYYSNRYKRSLETSATGLTAEQCKAVLSDDFLKFLKEDQDGYFSKVFKKKDQY